MDITALHGSMPALVTPLTPDGEVDEADLGLLVRRALVDGARGVLVAGSTGEGTLLEPEQRVQATAVARAAVERHHDDTRDIEEAAGHAPVVIAGASGPTMAALHADVARLASAGADAVLVLAPHTYPLTPDELAALHLAVAEHAGTPTLAYHIPQLTGSVLTPEAVAEMARHERIIGVKDSSPDADRRDAFAAVARDLPGFELVTGHAPTLHRALDAGVHGSITAIANVRQRQVVALHAAVAEDAAAEATELQVRLERISAAFTAIDGSLASVLKAALQLEGVIAERWCRAPLASVPPNRLDAVRTALLR